MNKYTQKQKTLDWLTTYGDLTVREAVKYLDIMDVRKRIEELRKEGYTIVTITKKSRTGARYGAYRLIEEAES